MDDSVADLMELARVDRLQITLDGPMNVYDLQRPYKASPESSFAAIIEGCF